MSKRPKVSVITITYNQERYIQQALESFVSQKTNFDFEVIVADDKSSDTTPQIIQEYAKQYPDIIKPILRKSNLGSMPNFVDALHQATGDYIALCEGDDYWTDPAKLQLQVDFLDEHSQYALCFHRVEVQFETGEQPPAVFPNAKVTKGFDLGSLLRANFIQTNSVLYRRQAYAAIPTNIVPGDWYMHLYHAQFGKIGFIDRVMGVYRRHSGGIWWAAHDNLDEIWKKYGLAHLTLFVEIGKLYSANPKYRAVIDDHINHMFQAIVKTDQIYNQDQLLQAVQRFPEATASYIRTSSLRQEQAIGDLTKHANDQATIIQHHLDAIALLEVKLQHPLRTTIKSRLGKD